MVLVAVQPSDINMAPEIDARNPHGHPGFSSHRYKHSLGVTGPQTQTWPLIASQPCRVPLLWVVAQVMAQTLDLCVDPGRNRSSEMPAMVGSQTQTRFLGPINVLTISQSKIHSVQLQKFP